jgi:molybdopterin synthase catalytic subunit
MYEWVVRPDCGAVVLFSGTVRDHAEGRSDVEHLEYEAYDEHVVPKLQEIAVEARERWSTLGKIVLVHRVGRLDLGESSVVAAVSAPHRPDAFAAARFAIDALKVSVPVWKREIWATWHLEREVRAMVSTRSVVRSTHCRQKLVARLSTRSRALPTARLLASSQDRPIRVNLR